jgi:tetratricopeptide (TPR) repeat protein
MSKFIFYFCCLGLFLIGFYSLTQLQISSAKLVDGYSLDSITGLLENKEDNIKTFDSITNLLSKGEITLREAKDSYDAISYYANASSRMTQGYYILALSCIEKSIDSFEKTNILKNYLVIDLSNAWALKSAILFKLNKYDQAVEAAEMSTNIAPYNEYAWLIKGSIYQSMERLSEAIDCYNCTIIANPMNNDTIIYANNYRSICLKRMSSSPSSPNTIAPVYFPMRKLAKSRMGAMVA